MRIEEQLRRRVLTPAQNVRTIRRWFENMGIVPNARGNNVMITQLAQDQGYSLDYVRQLNRIADLIEPLMGIVPNARGNTRTIRESAAEQGKSQMIREIGDRPGFRGNPVIITGSCRTHAETPRSSGSLQRDRATQPITHARGVVSW
jgi:hypothetical protein